MAEMKDIEIKGGELETQEALATGTEQWRSVKSNHTQEGLEDEPVRSEVVEWRHLFINQFRFAFA